MMIHKCSDADKVPEWLDGAVSADVDEAKKVASVKESMTEAELVAARSEIEQCARQGETFHFSDKLDRGQQAELREYAAVVGLPPDQMQSVDSVRRERAEIVAKARESEASEPAELKKPVVEFDLIPEEATEGKHFEQNDSWNAVAAAKTMDYEPGMTGAVIPVRGGEEYEKNPVKGVRPGEASVAAPDAIGTMAESEEKSTLEIIREQNEKRLQDTAFDRDAWEAEFAAKMKEATAIVPKPGVVRTENPEPQRHTPGAAWHNSIMGSPDEEPVPDRTLGETLAEKSAARRSEIQRSSEDDRSWDERQSSVVGKVTDVFFESLKKQMEGIGDKKE